MATALEMDPILKAPYPAKAHARRVAQALKAKAGVEGGLIYLEAQKKKMLEDNDGEAPFRQRRFFFYLSGCPLPDTYLTYDIACDQLTLYLPPLDEDDVIWSGLPISPQEASTLYDVDEVKYSTPALSDDVLSYSSSKTTPVFTIEGQVSQFLPADLDTKLLRDVIEDERSRKDEYEIAMIRHANKISRLAHEEVMKNVKGFKTEAGAEALFLKTCIENGAREQAYGGIFAAGRAAATLHYVKNDSTMEGKQMILVDAGGEYKCYASDITRTYPINGEFTKESREIYDIVLQMQKECLAGVKAGVQWESLHELAHKIAIEGLLKIGILRNGTAEEIWGNRTSVAFFPHGLGHMLGMDTHDTGGQPNYADKDPAFRYLRIRKKLEAGNVVTVEPGVYFCEFIIRPYLEKQEHAKYIDEKVLEKYWDVGGVRIEDNVVVTETGYENLTDTVKEVEDMLALINSPIINSS